MVYRSLARAGAVAALILVTFAGVRAEDAKKYPDWDGLWKRGSPVGVWDPTKPGGRGQQPPLTAEYQKVFEDNLAKGRAGVMFDIKNICGPVGMPRMMIMYEPMEIIVKPKVTHMLLESMQSDPAHLYGRAGLAQGTRFPVHRLLDRQVVRYGQ